jgi:hypothetical protein
MGAYMSIKDREEIKYNWLCALEDLIEDLGEELNTTAERIVEARRLQEEYCRINHINPYINE